MKVWLSKTAYVHFEKLKLNQCRLCANRCYALREKCPNTEFFLVHIFLYSVQMQENKDQKKIRIWTLLAQWWIKKHKWRSRIPYRSVSELRLFRCICYVRRYLTKPNLVLIWNQIQRKYLISSVFQIHFPWKVSSYIFNYRWGWCLLSKLL